MKLYEDGKQYNSKTNLWKATKTIMLKIYPAEVKELSKLTDYRLLAFIEKMVTILNLKDSKIYHMCLL